MTKRQNATAHVELFRQALGFEGIGEKHLEEIAGRAHPKSYAKGEVIFHQADECRHFQIVASGIVKVAFCSAGGTSITYLLAEKGEPLNLVGPFTGLPRMMHATALETSELLLVERNWFVDFAFRNPALITNIIQILGQAIDSANTRIIDMMEKRVRERVIKILHVLNNKFGDRLAFTSSEIAELAGTTTESTLRCLGYLREKGIIRSGRGALFILEPLQLEQFQDEFFWI